jgi:hypothetical protein
MNITETQGSIIDLINESVSRVYTESTRSMRDAIVSQYKGKGNIFLTEEEIVQYEDHIKMAFKSLRQLDYTMCGILKEDSSMGFSEEFGVIHESNVDIQIARWKKEVTDALAKVNHLANASNYKSSDAGKKALTGLIIGLIGTGVAILLAEVALPIGCIALMVSLGAALYYLFDASDDYDESEKLDKVSNHTKYELRIKAKRILPQLDELERKSTNKATTAAINSLRSALEAVALDEYEEDRELEIRKVRAAHIQASYTKEKNDQLKHKYLDIKDRQDTLEKKFDSLR